MEKPKQIKGKIGLEIHAYLVTKEKLFCKCMASREKGIKPNTLICPICTGQPGAKPMLPNFDALKKAIMVGLMLNCKINNHLIWKRKHYDWPDLPKGYQNTLSGKEAVPLGVEGEFEGNKIWSMHLEEDPASWEPSSGKVDYNRSGIPLVEIITAPDFSNSEGVTIWLKKLIHNLGYLKIVDSDAGIKVDVNVNIPGKTERVEIKNINSIENIGNAIEYELERQMKEGNEIKETRRYDERKNLTIRMRGKESGEDYRFISDPDLININIGKKMVLDIKKKLPESPQAKMKKIIDMHHIDRKNAEILAKDVDIAAFFEKVVEKVEPKFALPWISVELLRVLNYNGSKLEETDIRAEHFIELLNLVRDKKITELQAKNILNKFYPKSFSPDAEEKITDEKKLEEIVRKVINRNKKATEDYSKGDTKSLNYLIGESMKETNNRADFKILRKLLEKVLKKR